MLRALLLSPFVGQRLRAMVSAERHEDLLVLSELIEAGQVTPVLDTVYPLSDVPAAIRRLEERRVRGKVVVTVSGADAR